MAGLAVRGAHERGGQIRHYRLAGGGQLPQSLVGAARRGGGPQTVDSARDFRQASQHMAASSFVGAVTAPHKEAAFAAMDALSAAAQIIGRSQYD